MPKLAITEWQTNGNGKQWPSSYRYVRYDHANRLHVFASEDGNLELFAKRKHPISGWQLVRGAYYYEFCRAATL